MTTSPFLAPIYTVNQVDCSDLSCPEGDLRNKRYQIVMRTIPWSLQHRDCETIISDTGVIQEHYASSSTYQAAKAEASQLNQVSFDQHIAGQRFTRYLTNRYVSVDQVEANRHAGIDHTPPDRIQITPDVEILYFGPGGLDGAGRILWSDGKMTKATGFHSPAGGTITPAAFRLIRYALETTGWRTSGAWRKLLNVQSYDLELIREYTDRTVGWGSYSTDDYRLHRLTTDDGRVFYLVSDEGGGICGDGDAWENYDLYENEYEAQVGFRRQIIFILKDVLRQAASYLRSGYTDQVVSDWPDLTAWAKAVFEVKLPLQQEFLYLANDPDATANWYGWSMYLEGFAQAL